MKEYLFLISQENPSLALAECKAVTQKAEKWGISGNTITCESDKKPNWKRLAFTKKGYKIIKKGSKKDVKKWLENNKTKYKRTVRVDKQGLITSSEAQKIILEWFGKPKVNLTKPDKKILVIKQKEMIIAQEEWENTEDFEKRKNQNRPAPHPTSLNPKLARAMINLANPKKEILDPFCGSGGILIEAGLMGLITTGIDIDKEMIKRAKINTKHYKVKTKLIIGNAINHNKKTEAIITDLPYGRNSKAEELTNLYTKFLKKSRKLTKKLIIAFPSITKNKKIIANSKWKIKQKFKWRLHKNLEKEIYQLESVE